MIVINNNNGPSERVQEEKENLLVEKVREIGLRCFFGSGGRRLYILLSLTAPWCGIAHFYVGRIFLGIISIVLTTMAVPGLFLLAAGMVNPPPLWGWIVPLLSAALLPWLCGIVTGIYWSLHTDEEFQNKFFKH